MLLNTGIFYYLLLYFFNFDGIQGVPTNDEGVKEYEKSGNILKKESRFQFMISTDKLMWKDASLACKKKGMALACLDTFEKRKQFLAVLERDATPSSVYERTEYWIGGFREPHSFTKFHWENGNFINSYGWVSGEPNYYPNEYCLEVKVFVKPLGWNDIHCDKLSRYICMYDNLEEKTKNREHIDINTQPLESYEEENKNLEVAESTTVHTGMIWKLNRGYFPRHWGPVNHIIHDPMYDVEFTLTS